MPRQLPDSKTLVLKVIKTFQTEANRKKPIAGFSNPLQRAALTLGLSRKCVDRILKSDSDGPSTSSTNTDNLKSETKQRSKVDSFDTHVIRTAVTELIHANKTIDIKSLCVYLIDKKEINVSKFVLWKTLHIAKHNQPHPY